MSMTVQYYKFATSVTTSLSIDGITLPVVKPARDLGVLVSHDLSLSLHISTIVAKAHKRSAAIYRAFTCRNTYVLIRAYLTFGHLLNMTL